MGSTANANKMKNDNIPSICRFWSNLQNSLPSIQVFGLDVSLTIASVLLLSLHRFMAEFVLVNVFGWPSNNLDTKLAASSCSSVLHSLNLVPTLYILLVSTVKPRYNPSAPMAEETAGQWWNDTVVAMLQFCTGYMLYDSFFLCYLKTYYQEGGLNGEDLMFLGHHAATTLYMSSTRWYRAGHQSAMMCMLLGECTNPLHNSFYIAIAAQKFDCCNGEFSQSVYATIEFLFGLSYTIMRTIIAVPFITHATINLLSTGMFKVKELPKWLIIVWILLMWAVLIGSIPWVFECWGFVLKRLPEDVANSLVAIFGGTIPVTSREEL